MREIKFRGKSRKTGEWLVGDLLQVANEVFIAPSDGDWFDFIPWSKNNVFHLPSATYEVDPDTVGQFTGLLDKNGKEIYEGDVIKVITFGFDPEKFITEIKYGCSGGVLGFHLANGRSLFYFGQSDYSRLDDTTIIGNIHDNPELLSNDEHDPGTSVN